MNSNAGKTLSPRFPTLEKRSPMKSGYKQTEVGTIPAEWECVRIASVAKLESGHTPSKRKPTYWGGQIPWVSLHDTAG